MNSETTPPEKLRVLIAGGSVAALETCPALHELAPELTDVSVIAPNEDFVYRPMTVREPFAYGAAQRYPLAPIISDAGAELIADKLAWVDPKQRRPHRGRRSRSSTTRSCWRSAPRPPSLPARGHDRRPPHRRDPARAHPGHRGWLPEEHRVRLSGSDGVAAAAVRARADDRRARIRHERRARRSTIVTPEDSPLAIFGADASSAVAALLDAREHPDDHLRLRRSPQHRARS